MQESQKLQLASGLVSQCGIEPVMPGEQENTIKMTAGCSCSQLEGLIEEEFGDCVSSSIAGPGCIKDSVINAIQSSCGYRVLGC